MMKYKDRIVFDTETTGLLNPEASSIFDQPHIIEIYAARIDRKKKIIDEIETFFSVPVMVEPHIVKLTGIEDSMLIGAPQFIEVYKQLTELFMGTVGAIGHNLPFDMGMLWVELKRVGKEFHFPWPPEWYCTMEHSLHIENKRLKLSRLHEHATGIEHKDGAHRAKQDVLATLRCYKWLKKNKM